MIYQEIYKIKVHKLETKIFDLWGKELISLQKRYIKIIQKILERQYKGILEELKTNSEAKYNELFIDQTQFIKKDFVDDLADIVAMIQNAFTIWVKQLNKLLNKDVSVATNFGLQPNDAIAYAQKHAGELVSNVDAYSKKRINQLVTQWLDSWWWYNKLADALQQDFSFSDYRARLIASNEIWSAYINWKSMQFDRYRSEYNQKWWKKWVSHRDDVTTAECLANDDEWWIPFNQAHQSGHMHPLRFPWCRCNEEYRLFNPNE